MINGRVYTIFLQLRGRAQVESLGMSSFKSRPLKVGRAWKRAHRDDRAISGVSFPSWTTHTHTYTVRCTHVHKHTHAHTPLCTTKFKHTHPCMHIYTGDHPSIAGTSGIAVTCFEEAGFISLVRRWEPEDDQVQIRSDWTVSRPSLLICLTAMKWPIYHNINTTMDF